MKNTKTIILTLVAIFTSIAFAENVPLADKLTWEEGSRKSNEESYVIKGSSIAYFCLSTSGGKGSFEKRKTLKWNCYGSVSGKVYSRDVSYDEATEFLDTHSQSEEASNQSPPQVNPKGRATDPASETAR